MAEQLVIYLHETDTLYADWVFTQRNGELTTVTESGPLAELVEKNKNTLATVSQIVCIVGADILFYSEVNIPAKNKQRALQAIPFALEDQLAEDIEALHFAIGKAENSRYPVASIAHSTLKSLIEKLQQAGIKPDAIFADALCLPQNSRQWTLLQHKDKTSIRTDNGDVITTDNESLPVFIHSLLKQKEEHLPQTISVYLEADHELTGLSAPENIEIKQVRYKQTPLSLFCPQLNQPEMLNLLQGPYQAKKQSKQWWQPWKTAAVIAAAALVLQLISGSLNLNRLQHENQLINNQITQIYKKSFPRSKKIVNARVQMENKLKQLKKSSGKSDYSFTDILLDSAPLIKQTAGAEIQGINYHNRKLEIQLVLDKLSTAENLKNQLNKLAHIKAELLSASSEAKQVNARIRLEAL